MKIAPLATLFATMPVAGQAFTPIAQTRPHAPIATPPGTSRLMMGKLFDQEIAPQFSDDRNPAQRCGTKPVPTRGLGRGSDPEGPRIPWLRNRADGEGVSPLIEGASPPAGRESFDITTGLARLIYEPDFREAMGGYDHLATLSLADHDRVSPSRIHEGSAVHAVTDNILLLRSVERAPDGSRYVHTRVVFRGTDFSDSRDRSVDLHSFFSSSITMPLGEPQGRSVEVGQGWVERYEEHRAAIRRAIDEDRAAAVANRLPHHITFVGHSLGGAVCVLAATDEACRHRRERRGDPPIHVVALSPARVGYGQKFGALALELQDAGHLDGVQVRQSWDPVSSGPPGAREPEVPLVELRGVAPTPLQALDNHDVDHVRNRLGTVLDGGKL
ncbi:MAG: hypothetical protein AAF799_27665 [Myxococcota bacterium]